MKLSRTGWNNVIIFSVMTIILLINATNDKLFPDEENNKAERLILPQHSVILTLDIELSDTQHVLVERAGRGWQVTTKGIILDKTEQQIEQMIFSWQQSQGLVQAADMVIDNAQGITVTIVLASELHARTLILYPLNDQLLIYQQQDNIWLALPATLAQQLLPINL
ncbi:hypothetical protein [Colwellia ponticola]|uniref:DUF4340 domain-containing protein n=1 Tax=Colwellia ponticola TaxID=2304625 RepID=A0A8H2JME6_9GAMM|nr:hypothetical protein [Colwellia ponticola]TMM45688.1 hypothetical protein FCS21_07650 [Colwellia ponticola]